MKPNKNPIDTFRGYLHDVVRHSIAEGMAWILFSELGTLWWACDAWETDRNADEEGFLFHLLAMAYGVDYLSDDGAKSVRKDEDSLHSGAEAMFALMAVSGEKEKAAVAMGQLWRVLAGKEDGLRIEPAL